MLAEIFEKIS